MQVTVSHKRTKNYGSILHRSTRTRIKASRVAAKIGEYLLYQHQVRCTRCTLNCTRAPWAGVSPGTTSMGAIAVVVALHYLPTLPALLILDQTAATTTTVRCTQATPHKGVVTTIWSSQNERCIRAISPCPHLHDYNIQRELEKRAPRP